MSAQRVLEELELLNENMKKSKEELEERILLQGLRDLCKQFGVCAVQDTLNHVKEKNVGLGS